MRVKHLGVVWDGKLWVGGNLEVTDLSLSHGFDVQGDAKINTLLFQGSFPRFAKLPSITTLAGRDKDPLKSWQTPWHDKLPKLVVQAKLFVPEHARSNMDVLVETLAAGKQLRAR